jgi:hypothetical protein
MRQRVCWYTWWLDGGGLPPSLSLFLLPWDSRCHSRFNCVLNFVFISILALDNLNVINVDFNAFWSFLFAISSLSVLFHLFFVSNLVLVLFIVFFFLSYLFFNFPLYISFHWNFVSKFCLYSFYCHFFFYLFCFLNLVPNYFISFSVHNIFGPHCFDCYLFLFYDWEICFVIFSCLPSTR